MKPVETIRVGGQDRALLTVPEVCQVLNMCRSRVYDKLNAGSRRLRRKYVVRSIGMCFRARYDRLAMSTLYPAVLPSVILIVSLGLLLNVVTGRRRTASAHGDGMTISNRSSPRADRVTFQRPRVPTTGTYRARYGTKQAILPPHHHHAPHSSSHDFVRVTPRPELEPDYYAVLRVSPTATRDELVRTFRRQVSSVHPDLHFQDPVLHKKGIVRLKELNAAMVILRDPSLRAQYDARRSLRARISSR